MKKYLTVYEAAILARVSCRTIRRWATSRRIRSFRRGNHIIIDATAFHAFLDHRAKTRPFVIVARDDRFYADTVSLHGIIDQIAKRHDSCSLKIGRETFVDMTAVRVVLELLPMMPEKGDTVS